MQLHSRKNLFLLTFFLIYGFKLDPVFGFRGARTNRENVGSEEKEETYVTKTKNFLVDKEGDDFSYLDKFPPGWQVSTKNKKVGTGQDSEEINEDTKSLEAPKGEEIQHRRSTSEHRKLDGVRRESEQHIGDESDHLEDSDLGKISVNDYPEPEEDIGPDEIKKVQMGSTDNEKISIRGAENTQREIAKTNTKIWNKNIPTDVGSGRRIVSGCPPCPLPIDIRMLNPDNSFTDGSGRRFPDSVELPLLVELRQLPPINIHQTYGNGNDDNPGAAGPTDSNLNGGAPTSNGSPIINVASGGGNYGSPTAGGSKDGYSVYINAAGAGPINVHTMGRDPNAGLPMYNSPMGGFPTYNTPMGGIQTYNTPIGGLPMYNSPMYNPPMGGVPGYNNYVNTNGDGCVCP